jgi:hypothetical protein
MLSTIIVLKPNLEQELDHWSIQKNKSQRVDSQIS